MQIGNEETPELNYFTHEGKNFGKKEQGEFRKGYSQGKSSMNASFPEIDKRLEEAFKNMENYAVSDDNSKLKNAFLTGYTIGIYVGLVSMKGDDFLYLLRKRDASRLGKLFRSKEKDLLGVIKACCTVFNLNSKFFKEKIEKMTVRDEDLKEFASLIKGKDKL